MKTDFHNSKNLPRVRCTKCNEQILRNRELVVNKRTICLGCAVEMGLTQKMRIDMNHKLILVPGLNEQTTPKFWSFMSNLLTTYQLTW